MWELESFSILDVPDQVVSKVARVVAAVGKMGIQIRWLDKVIDDTRRYHSTLA